MATSNIIKLAVRTGAPALAIVGILATGGVGMARQASPADQQPERSVAPVPYGPGERAGYQVKLGGIGVGSGSMEIHGIESIHGHPTYHATLTVSGGVLFARVDDRFDTWIDVEGLFSRRFKQNQRELNFRRNRTYDFYPESRSYRRLDNGEVGRLPTEAPLDDVSFLYYARTLPLEVGDVYTIPRYFKEDGNPVVIKVLRRETITVPAGTFRTVVVQPVIKTDGLFGEGGRAEVFFTDDDRRILVQMTSRVPVVGSLSLHLREYRAGATP
jgi:hypothetical protein